jgi:hypothetical protein
MEDAAGALPLFRRAADGFDSLLGPGHPSSRTARANYQALEREVELSEELELLERVVAGLTTRQTSAEKSEIGSGLKPYIICARCCRARAPVERQSPRRIS